MKGWVYVIANKAMPGLVKVGYSMKDPELRAAELNHTGSPHPYVVDYEVLVEEPRGVEQKVHGQLRDLCEGKEWFRCTSEEAIAAISCVVSQKALAENFKRADRAKAEAIQKQADEDRAKAKAIQKQADADAKAIREKANAKESARRATEEKGREQKAILDSKRREINSHYEQRLNEALPRINYWVVFALFFIALGTGINLYSPKMKDTGVYIFSAIGAFILTSLVKKYAINIAKNSNKYKSIIKQRDIKLYNFEKIVLKYENYINTELSKIEDIYKEKELRIAIRNCPSCGKANTLTERTSSVVYYCGICRKPIDNPFS